MEWMFAAFLILMYPARSGVVTFPAAQSEYNKQNYVVVVLDKQPLSVSVDSGTARFFVIYGKWFESVYGEGSCEELKVDCYFCPAENPCDDIGERSRISASYGKYEVYQYVQHRGTLDLGQSTIPFTFGLVVNHSNVYDLLPTPILGLSFGRPDIPNTFLQQLKDSNVIDTLSYSMFFQQHTGGGSGKLVVGDSASSAHETLHLPLWRIPNFNCKVCVHITSITFNRDDTLAEASSSRGLSGAFSTSPSSSMPLKLALFDTGTSVIDMPQETFDAVVRETRAAITAHNPTDRAERVLWHESDVSGWRIRRKYVQFLPTMVYSVIVRGNRTADIRITPEHYIESCTDSDCRAHVYVNDGPRTCLGKPFFRAYAAHVNLGRKMLSITPHR